MLGVDPETHAATSIAEAARQLRESDAPMDEAERYAKQGLASAQSQLRAAGHDDLSQRLLLIERDGLRSRDAREDLRAVAEEIVRRQEGDA